MCDFVLCDGSAFQFTSSTRGLGLDFSCYLYTTESTSEMMSLFLMWPFQVAVSSRTSPHGKTCSESTIAWRISHFNPEGKTPHVHFHAYSTTRLPLTLVLMWAFLNITHALFIWLSCGLTLCTLCSNWVFCLLSVWSEVAVPHPAPVTLWLHDPVTC